MIKWQPIDTCPKNEGEDILVYVDRWIHVVTAQWMGGISGTFEAYLPTDDEGRTTWITVRPTHWAPMSKLPDEDEE